MGFAVLAQSVPLPCSHPAFALYHRMLKSAFALLLAAMPLGAAIPETARASNEPPISQRTIETSPHDPLQHWEFDYETGVIRKVGGGATPLVYVVLPQLLTWKLPVVGRRPFAGGELSIRTRLSLLIEPIIKGPESRYLGASASGCVEWWNAERTTSFFFSSGGGLGVMDSKGHQIKGAQGQDLNFNWLVYVGARKKWTPRMSASLGLYFQHVSNTGLDKINPGLNALGPMFGLSWHY